MRELLNIRLNCCRDILAMTLLMLITLSLHAQSDKKFIRKGNRDFEKNKFAESEVYYRKAMNKGKSPDAGFNVGDALYKQDKFEEAGNQFAENAGRNDDKLKKSNAYYNLGNSLLQANKLEESIQAYKESLKLQPGNEEAKYNLAYAQDLLQQQQNQQQQQQNRQEQDKKDQDQQNKQGNSNQQDNQNQDQQQQSQQNNQDQQPGEEQKGISKEDAERLLDAISNDEKDVQEKVKLEKAARTKVRTEKNW